MIPAFQRVSSATKARELKIKYNITFFLNKKRKYRVSGKNLAVFKMAALLISINVILLSNREIPSHERARVKISDSAKIQNPKRETNV